MIVQHNEAHGGASATNPGGRIPDFFVIGHPKSGTTALHTMLDSHPGIFMSTPKEPMFLADDMRMRFESRLRGNDISSMGDYLALFDGATSGQAAGEASTLYVLSEPAPRSISALNRDARIIGLFREPASYLRSLHLQLLQTHGESERSLRRALELEPYRRSGRKVPRRSPRPQLLRYSDHVKYTEQLRRYRDAFPDDQILVLIYEEFRQDNEGTLREVFRFLGVDDSVGVSTVDANPTVGIRSHALHHAVHGISVGTDRPSRWVKSAIKGVTPQSVRRRALHAFHRQVIYGAPPQPDPAYMVELRRRLRPEVERFSEYLDRDLVTLWGYQDA